MALKTKHILIGGSIIFTVAGLVYFFVFSKRKSFLKMDEVEKLEFVEEEAKKRYEIRNDPNLTLQEKQEAELLINQQNIKNLTEEEKIAIADYNIKRLMRGDFNIFKQK